MLSGQGAADCRVKRRSTSYLEEETRLMARIQAGDLRAFEHLYRSYHPRLTRFLTNLIHRPQLVEEALDDTMLVVWNQPGRYNGHSRLSTWIFGIAYRKGLKALRRDDQPVKDKDPDGRISGEAGPEQQLGDRQVQGVLLHAISQLSPDHRAVVDLTYFHDIGYRETAEIMDCPVDTVKTRMYYARRHLRRMLAERLGGEV